MVLCICVTHTDGLHNCEMSCRDAHSIKPELNSMIKEADGRPITHVLGRSTKISVSPTDVLVLLMHYFDSRSDQFITYGTYLALAITQDTFLIVLWYRTMANLKLFNLTKSSYFIGM